jgi:hypothetical protein
VGVGHKRRALAHGYSINLNPFGVQNPSLDSLTPGVQPKIRVKISPKGEGKKSRSPALSRGERVVAVGDRVRGLFLATLLKTWLKKSSSRPQAF